MEIKPEHSTSDRYKIIQRGEGHKDLGRFFKYLSDVYYLMEDKEKGEKK